MGDKGSEFYNGFFFKMVKRYDIRYESCIKKCVYS